jgi:hypothetical protein
VYLWGEKFSLKTQGKGSKMAQATQKSTSSKHWLRFLENEDEAQMTGWLFEVDGDTVVVSETFHFDEYEGSRRAMDRVTARKFWKTLIASGQFEQG